MHTMIRSGPAQVGQVSGSTVSVPAVVPGDDRLVERLRGGLQPVQEIIAQIATNERVVLLRQLRHRARGLEQPPATTRPTLRAEARGTSPS